MKVTKNEHLNVNGDLNANGIDDDDENNNKMEISSSKK